ncbi:hypothetical protein NBRC116599_14590 [Aquicoccus sp. SU-CL01552]
MFSGDAESKREGASVEHGKMHRFFKAIRTCAAFAASRFQQAPRLLDGPQSARSKRGGVLMARSTVEQRALALLNTFERAGKAVSRVTVEGRRIELVLASEQDSDEFDRIDMRHGKA